MHYKEKGNDTLSWYERNAERYVASTLDADMRPSLDRFLYYIKRGGLILDFGCGSGRDSLYFLSKGFSVEAIDGSSEICQKASANTGLEVKRMLFTELDEEEKYDGIWACSSILHLPLNHLHDVFHRIEKALKREGALYTSFKYGDFQGIRDGRYYTDFTFGSFGSFIGAHPSLIIEEIWISLDVRKDREGERWLSVILRKS